MKLWPIILKNVKVLFRSKGTFIMTIFGPLLIILLVGLAFNNAKAFAVSAGVYAKDDSPLGRSFIDNLKQDNFNVREFTSEEDCVRKIKEGAIHTCIVFPDGFRIENSRTNEIVVHVDNSRQNIIYQVVSSLSKNIEFKSQELSLGMTNTLISTMFSTRDAINADILKAISLKKGLDDLAGKTDIIISDTNKIDLQGGTANLAPVMAAGQDLQYSVKLVHDKGLDIVREARAFAVLVEENTSFDVADFEESVIVLKGELDTLYNESPQKLRAISAAVDEATAQMQEINRKVAQAQKDVGAIADSMKALKQDLDKYRDSVDVLSSSLQHSVAGINAIEVTNAASIISPITTRISPVATAHTKLTFLFPSLLVLVILIIGILLAGTIVVMEKTSKAAFRNFTTPTSPERFLLGHFLTAVGVILAQVILILAIASFFFPAFSNAGITIILILLACVLFVLMGILIGNLFSTQEGVMMVSMSVATVLLLLSNFIFPLEDISGLLAGVAAFNPFVVASDAIRKAVLFDARLGEVIGAIGLLFLYCAVLAGFVLASKDFTKNKRRISGAFLNKRVDFSDDQKGLLLGKAAGKEAAGKDAILSLEDLKSALQKMSDADFTPYLMEKNDIALWVAGVLQEKRLGKLLEGKSRAEMIGEIEEHLAREQGKQDHSLFKGKRKI